MFPNLDTQGAISLINSLKSSFEDYLDQFTVNYVHTLEEIQIEFTVLNYDLIDDDLDFDEDYYQNLVSHFRKWLFTVSKQVVRDYKVAIIIVENSLVFRHEKTFLSRHEFKPKIDDTNCIFHTVHTIEKV